MQALFDKKEPTPELVDLNEAGREVIALSLGTIQIDGVILRTEFVDDLPLVIGDRVQLQQVIMNLIQHARDAASTVGDRPRQLLIKTERHEGGGVCFIVKEVGTGPQAIEKIFDAFYTTKNDRKRIGLSVSRTIIESHDGRL